MKEWRRIESDIRMLMDNVTPELRTKYGKDSPQYVLWQEQKKYNSLKNKRQIRWHPLVIRFAFSIFFLQSSLSNSH